MENAKLTKLTNRDFNQFKQELNTTIDLYKQLFSEQTPTNWQRYEKEISTRLQIAYSQIQTVIDQAAQPIKLTGKPRGRPPNTSAKKKTLLLLHKTEMQFSGRKMQNHLPTFVGLQQVQLSYKTIQRAYSNPLVQMIIHNTFIVLVHRKGIKTADLTGDGTGYSLTITKHYRTVRAKKGEKVKSNEAEQEGFHGKPEKPLSKQVKRKVFTFSFALMDLKTHMYVGYGASLKSERAAYEAALKLMAECGVEADSIRLDQFYAGQSTAELFGSKSSLYLMPKKNASIRGCYAWKDMIRDFMCYPFLFLKEYFRRERSESGFSADKRFCGWKISERNDDRVLTATMCKGVWHNLVWLGGGAT